MSTDRIGRIALYDAYLSTLGGGENIVAVLAELLESAYPQADLDIITHEGNEVPIERLAERFGVSLGRARVRQVSRDAPAVLGLRPVRRIMHESHIARLSAQYDLFVNNTIYSLTPPRSRYSVYMCMFPLTPMPWSLRGQPRRARLLAPYVALRRHLYRRWLRRYDLLLAISEFTRGWIRRLWRLDADILYPPVETRSQLCLVRKQRRILAVGRFFPGNHNKKHDVLIRAFRKLRAEGLSDWELHLVGGKTRVTGTEDYLQRLSELAAGEPVFFHVDAPRTTLEELLETSSLFWHGTGYGEDGEREPEKLEHFGISTVEAMSYGCVPLAYHCGGQPEIIEPERSGVLWRDLEELHRGTLRLTRDRELRETVARRAHARSQDFGRDAFRRRVRSYLHALVDAETGSAA